MSNVLERFNPMSSDPAAADRKFQDFLERAGVRPSPFEAAADASPNPDAAGWRYEGAGSSAASPIFAAADAILEDLGGFASDEQFLEQVRQTGGE